MFCVLAHVLSSKPLLPFIIRKNFMKLISAKETLLLNDCVCGKRKHAYLFALWGPITNCITSVIGDHLCVLSSRTCSVVKKPFCLSRMYTPFPWGCTHSIKAPRLGLGGHRPAAKFIGEMTMNW